LFLVDWAVAGLNAVGIIKDGGVNMSITLQEVSLQLFGSG